MSQPKLLLQLIFFFPEKLLIYSKTIYLRRCFNKRERGTCKRVRKGQIGRDEKIEDC